MYRKGACHERQLARKLGEHGFEVIRAAGSGKNTPDLIAGMPGKVYAFECKYSTKDAVYIEKAQIDNQVVFAKNFGALLFVAIKFKNVPWAFLTPGQLVDTGKNYKVSKSLAKGGKKLRQLLYKDLNDFSKR